MKTTLLALPLLSLLLGFSACSKKSDDPAPTTTAGTGSFTLSGQLTYSISGYASATAYDFSSSQGNNTLLTITINSTPKLQRDSRYVKLQYTKPTGQPNSAYRILGISFDDNPQNLGDVFAAQVNTLTMPTATSFSGTFSGGAGVNYPQTTITGSFMEASL